MLEPENKWKIGFWIKNFTTRRISKIFFVLSNFEMKNLRVRFWIENKTTRQILNWKFYNVSDSEMKKVHRFRFWIKISTTCQIL